ncbi:MAG: alpha/beta hydrolase [Polaromonas sp.]|nr:alpha/beta hydrolase [Polaromonas sp.]
MTSASTERTHGAPALTKPGPEPTSGAVRPRLLQATHQQAPADADFSDRRAPPKWLLLAETRAVGELAITSAMWPWLQWAPRGDGHAVVVIPGLAASDISTRILRVFLTSLGYKAYGWCQGHNRGLDTRRIASLERAVQDLHAETGRKVSLVGWSLGGLYARMLASAHPDKVRSVITMGSPFTGNPFDNNAWPLYQAINGRSAAELGFDENGRQTPPVPTTSIFSRSDGLINWHCTQEAKSDRTENIEVVSSHLGLGHHPAVLYAVADRLAQPEGAWAPFNRVARNSLVYPPVTRQPRPFSQK